MRYKVNGLIGICAVWNLLLIIRRRGVGGLDQSRKMLSKNPFIVGAYLFVNESMTWMDAYNYCLDEGGLLAAPSDKVGYRRLFHKVKEDKPFENNPRVDLTG